MLTLLEARRLHLSLEGALGQLLLLVPQLPPDGLDALAQGLAPHLPVTTEFGLVKLLLFEAGDGLATEEDLLLTARLLGLGLLTGYR